MLRGSGDAEDLEARMGMEGIGTKHAGRPTIQRTDSPEEVRKAEAMEY